MALLLRNCQRLTPLGSIRSYSEVVNVFGRRNVDTVKEKKAEPVAQISESIERVAEVVDHPKEHVEGRKVRIYLQAKNPMQSGTHIIRKWKLAFDNRERWENPLMGWGSTGDPLSNLNLEFANKEDAIVYCQRMGFAYETDEPRLIEKRIKSYGANFSWNKRTRRSAK